jgi:hypothetical protein
MLTQWREKDDGTLSGPALEADGLNIDGSYTDRSTADSNASVDDVVYVEDEQTLGIKRS